MPAASATSTPAKIDQLVSGVQRQMETLGDEVSSAQIGEAVMAGLKALDHVAYIRFASIYKDFSEPGDFAEIAERVEKEVDPARPQQAAMSSTAAGHRPRPPAARPEYRQGGAGDAQFRADRDAAGRPARRLAQSRRRTRGERRGRGAGRAPRSSTRLPRPIADCSLVYASTVRRRDLVMPVVGPEEMAREIRALGGPLGDPVRARALGPRDRGRRARQPHRHRADQSRVRQPQPRPGGDPARL